MAKEGSVVSGLMDSFATAISLALQHGVPLKLLCDKFAHTRFDPAGFTSNPDIPRASSIMDYIFTWLRKKFIPILLGLWLVGWLALPGDSPFKYGIHVLLLCAVVASIIVARSSA